MDDKPVETVVPGLKKPRTLRRRIVVGVVWALLVAMCLGFWAAAFGGFVPSSLGTTIDLTSAAIGATLGIIVALKIDAARIRQLWMKDPFLRSLGMALTCGCMFAFAAGGVDWSYTAVFGTTSDRAVTVTSWRSGSFHVCAGPNFAEAPFTASVCLDGSWAAKLPPGTRLILSGRQTALGINTERVRLGPETSASAATVF